MESVGKNVSVLDDSLNCIDFETEIDSDAEEDLEKQILSSFAGINSEFETQKDESFTRDEENDNKRIKMNSNETSFCDDMKQLHFEENVDDLMLTSSIFSETQKSTAVEKEVEIENKNFEVAFKTGKNKTIAYDESKYFAEKSKFENLSDEFGDKSSLVKALEERSESNSVRLPEKPEKEFFEGFKTGRNKTIPKTGIVNKNGKYFVEISKNQPKGTTIRKYNCPQKGHITQRLKKNVIMLEIYDKVIEKYGNTEEYELDEINEQFKWTWLHYFLNPVTSLEEKVIEMVGFKLKNNLSVYKMMMKGEISTSKYCVLGILNVSNDKIELFDGFYSFTVKTDIKTMEALKEIEFGRKIHVFGMKKEKDELELKYNNWKMCNTKIALGYKNKVSFMTEIRRIQIDSGVVPAINFKIIRVVEEGYMIKVGNYKNKTTNIEREMEKIELLAEKANKKIERDDIVIRKYTKMIIADKTEECLLTWWNSPEYKKTDEFEMVNLETDKESMGLHLIATSKTYYKIK